MAFKRDKGRPVTQSTLFKTTLGWIGLTGTDEGITALVFAGPDRRRAETVMSLRDERADRTLSPVLREARQQVSDYLRGTRRTLTLPVDLSTGTPFQRRVWRAILRIPYGRVRSYQWVAVRVGGKRYARAVGMALGANPVPLVVPCHRIVSQDGSLGGFSCGISFKRRLLRLEGSLPLLQRR